MSVKALHDDVGGEDTNFLGFCAAKDSNTTEDIDEVLNIGVYNLSLLDNGDKVLKYLELKVKQEGNEVTGTVDRAFDELTASLLSRKRKLCAELMKSINTYSADIAKAKEVIEEKKKCLTGAIRLAKELKITPSLRSHCDLAQVSYNLKLPVKADLARVCSLVEKKTPRLYLNTDEITPLIKKLGKIEWRATGHEDDGLYICLDDKEEMLGCDTESSVGNMRLAISRESKMEAPANKLGVPEEVKNTQVQEKFPMIHHQSILAPPNSPSNRDVIIEEVFEDDLENDHADEQRKKVFKKETCRTGSTELVFLSHVINPCHFYVRRYFQKKEAQVLETKLENYCCNNSSYLLPSDVLELGARIFIKNKETGMWCRGVITELIPLECEDKKKPRPGISAKEASPPSASHKQVMRYPKDMNVLCTFPRGKVAVYVPAEWPESGAQTIETNDFCLFVRKPDQNIEAELAAIPPLAVRCSLKDLVPKNASEGWEEEAKTKFLGMVNNTAVSMTVFREENGVLIVDLRKPPFNKTSSNMPVSLKDALVFLDLASFRSQLPSQVENHTILRYTPPKIPQEGKEVSVIVCHINSPTDFYVQLRESLDSCMLSKKIQEVYKYEHEEHLEIVYPVEGQACVAKQEDGNWCRAQVIGLPSHQEVMVKYVDIGNVAILAVKDIRRVKREFLSIPEKAIRCMLAYIEPYKGANEWNREAKGRFEEMTEEKFMLCSVVDILGNAILSVELFDPSAVHGRSFSINFQLVKENLASYLVGYSESTAAGPEEVWDLSVEEILETWEDKNPVDMVSMHERDFKSLPEKELQVIISNVVSPSRIFVQCLSSEGILKSLQEKMESIYGKSQPQSVKWESSMHCAVYICALKQWQRGQIIRIVSETSAEVLLYDSGAEKTVDIRCLRKLDESIKIIERLAIECSLADIRPTGGSTQWTATVCEFLSYYLTRAQAKVIIQGSYAARPLSVKIHCKVETRQMIDVSELLIEKGLAFRNRRSDKASVPCSDSKERLKVHVEQENTQVDGSNSQTARAGNSAAPEENIIVLGSEQKSCKTYKSLLHSGGEEMYKPATIPPAKFFQAVVSCIGTDGTIYIKPKSFEIELNKLMTEIQRNIKYFGVPESYCWKKGAACLVRSSDNRWHRGKVVKVGGNALKVQYVDNGYIEKVLPRKLYPTTLYTDIPPFCIPCQLYKTAPIGNAWKLEAIRFLQGLLTGQEVGIHVQELPDNPWGRLSISLYFGEISLASFMAYENYCIVEDSQDILQLERLEGHNLVWLSYVLPPLPIPGDIFPVKVTHLVSPNEVYVSLDPCKHRRKLSATEGDAGCDAQWESLDEALAWCSENVESIPLLTHFQTEMPCLAEYHDGLWYRAKFLSIEKYDPVMVLIQFVDYGNYSVVSASRLRQMPYEVLKYPVEVVHVVLAGFKPALNDKNMKRIPYAPQWSEEALWAMIDCVEGKQLSACILALSPKIIIYLYDDEKNLVHTKLIEMGLAELDE